MRRSLTLIALRKVLDAMWDRLGWRGSGNQRTTDLETDWQLAIQRKEEDP
jgi:hypothetical protein